MNKKLIFFYFLLSCTLGGYSQSAQTLDTVTETHCNSFNWRGSTYTQTGQYKDTIWTDSTHTIIDTVYFLNLTINKSTSGDTSAMACDSFTWHGATYGTSTNTALWLTKNVAGCDSTVTLHLTIHNSSSGVDIQSHCDIYTWIDSNTYTVSTSTPTKILTNVKGCDSIVNLHLTIRNSTTRTDSQIQCDSYTWVDGITYTTNTTSPSIVLAAKNAANCDSLLQLNLIINHSSNGVDSIVQCDYYTWIDGNLYTSTTNTPTFTLRNSYGCDSTVTLHLTINNSSFGVDQQNHCDTYRWIDGILYTESTTIPTRVLTNALGCDSTVTLNLTIRNSNTDLDSQNHCDAYTWIDGNTYTFSTNTPTYTLTNVLGCDSIVTLNLTIRYSNSVIDSQSHCDTYTWIDGNTYTVSVNTPVDTLTNVMGCDSIVTLNLTVRNSNSVIDSQSHCDLYTWIDGNAYTVSTYTPTYTLTNAMGCDSIVTLNLTIRNSNTGIDTQSHCDTYTWIDGNTYTVSVDTPTDTLKNAMGCDSIVTLNLTIRNSTTGIDNHYVCGPFEWINGVTYDASIIGPIDTIVNMAGCDSVITLNLTIRHNMVLTKWNDVVVINDKEYGPFVGDNCNWYYCKTDTIGGELIGTGLYKQITVPGYYYVVAVKGNDTIVSCSQYMNPASTYVSSYPNPTKGYVTVWGGNWKRGDNIAVMTLAGKTVLHSVAQDAGPLTIDLSCLPDGVYFIKVGSEVVRAIKR